MDTFLSAVLGDLVSRSVSFIIDNYYQRQKGAEGNLHRLRCVLLRIQATVEEAEGRHITNQAMLQQVQMLREAMYKGYYLLDTFRYRMVQQKMTNDQVVNRSFASTKLNPAKRFCFSTQRINIVLQDDGLKEVQKMLERLHNIIDDMAEFLVFLNSYPPPITYQPYSKYLILDKCMFGRQAEMEKIINFLLHPEPPGAESLQILPVIGPPRVGKRTLVEHVCYDERVRNHFSSIILCSKDPTSLEGNGEVRKQAHDSHGRSLFVMELADDFVLAKRQCRKFYSLRSHMSPGSRVIITSRSESITELGTVGPIRLSFLPQEAYWYLFKVMAFGSTKSDEDPELASIAMKIAAGLSGSFLGANIICSILRANHHAQFWRKILELHSDHVQRHLHLFGEDPHTLYQKNQTFYLWRMSAGTMCIKVHHCQKLCHQKNDVPKINLVEVLIGSAEARGKFEVKVWKSCIPPYHSYMMSCEASHQMMAKKKRPYSMM